MFAAALLAGRLEYPLSTDVKHLHGLICLRVDSETILA
jgi:hypothetical protein